MAMTVFEMIFGIVLVTVIASMYNTKQKHKHQRRRSKEEVSELDARLDKLEELEQRVQVLERVVTDRKFDLKDEIDRL